MSESVSYLYIREQDLFASLLELKYPINCSTAAMAAGVVALQNYFNTAALTGFTSLLLPYTVILITAIAVFVLTCFFVKHPELTEIIGIARRRRK